MSTRRCSPTPTDSSIHAERVPLCEHYALDVAGCAAYSRVPETRIREAVARRELPVCMYGGGVERGRYVILRADFEAWLVSLRRPPLPEVER